MRMARSGSTRATRNRRTAWKRIEKRARTRAGKIARIEEEIGTGRKTRDETHHISSRDLGECRFPDFRLLVGLLLKRRQSEANPADRGNSVPSFSTCYGSPDDVVPRFPDWAP